MRHTIKYSYSPAIDAKRRLIVRADRPASPSSIHLGAFVGRRWALMNANTSPVTTSAESVATTDKNTFKSKWVLSSLLPGDRI